MLKDEYWKQENPARQKPAHQLVYTNLSFDYHGRKIKYSFCHCTSQFTEYFRSTTERSEECNRSYDKILTNHNAKHKVVCLGMLPNVGVSLEEQHTSQDIHNRHKSELQTQLL